MPHFAAHLDRLSPKDDKAFSSLHHEAGELVTQYSLNLVGLFDLDAESDGVDG